MKRMVCTMAAAAMATLSASTLAATYSNPSLLNLASNRNTTASVSRLDAGLPGTPLSPVYTHEVRFGVGVGGATWWQTEFPEVYRVDSYSFRYYPGLYSSMAVRVQTSLDGAIWTDRTGDLTGTQGTAGTFPGGAVDARYVRLNVLSYSGWSNMIVRSARLFGPNSAVEVGPAFSVAQSTWAGGSCTVTDAGGTRATTEVVDDDSYGTNHFGESYTMPGGGQPTTFIVNLATDSKFRVETVGLSTISDTRAARNVEVYVSTDPSGSNWTHALSIADMPYVTNSLNLYDLTTTVVNPKRVRFDVTSLWLGSAGYMGELRVYGSEIPEPATLGLLALGAAWAAGRRRPGTRAARA